jgi:hypothetical protein
MPGSRPRQPFDRPDHAARPVIRQLLNIGAKAARRNVFLRDGDAVPRDCPMRRGVSDPRAAIPASGRAAGNPASESRHGECINVQDREESAGLD